MRPILVLYTVGMIPRIFHRIWVGGTMPEEFIATGQTWLDMNPGWDMILWTDDNMIQLKNQAIYDAAPQIVDSRLVGRMRSNIARLEILHKYGGVYIDCDFVALKPIPDEYLSEPFFLARENENFVNNGIIGSIPKHPYLSKLIREIPISVATQPGKPSNVTTGPHLLTRLLPKSIKVIPTEQVYPYTWRDTLTGQTELNDEAWAHHLWAGSRHQVSVIVPWQPGCPHREASWRYLQNWFRLNAPASWQIIEARHDSDPFNKAQAIRDGFKRSFGKIIVVHDSDLFSDGLFEAVELVTKRHQWAIPHTMVYRLDYEASEEVLQGTDPYALLDRLDEKPYKGVIGGGIVVLRRELFEKCPPDNRFVGWGGEDEAWGYALQLVSNQPAARGKQPLIHLWHPPQERLTRAYGSLESKQLIERYRLAARRRASMLNLIKEHI